MKRLIFILLSVLSVLSVGAFNIGQLSFSVTASGEVSVSASSDLITGDIDIPETVSNQGQTYRVTTIGKWGFYQCSGISSINLPNSIKEIKEYSFSFCSGLKAVELPPSLTEISEYTFFNCTSLKSVKIPETVTHIGNSAFAGCSALTSVNIPAGVTVIKPWTFSNCASLTSIDLPDCITEIGENAFNGCSSLTVIYIPAAVLLIGDQAFYNCRNLAEISVNTGNESYCSIDGVLFDKTTNILIQYPAGKDVPEYFLPNTVTEIKEKSFSFCAGLLSVTIPAAVTEIGDDVFYGCSNLAEINVYENNSSFSSLDGILFNKDKSLLIRCPEGRHNPEYEIPSTVSTVGVHAFCNCIHLVSVNIPSSVTDLESAAFYNCSSLSSVTLPNSITEISSGLFIHCSGLTSANIASSVETIGSFAFCDCVSLTEITIPNSVGDIGESAFENCVSLSSIVIGDNVSELGAGCFSGCYAINQIYCHPLTPPTTPPVYFFYVFETATFFDATLYVPSESVNLYENIEPWYRFRNIVGTDLSAVDNVSPESGIQVTVSNGCIIIRGVEETENINVHNLSGSLIYSGTASLAPSLQPGLYIVEIAGTITKIVI